MNRIDSVVCYIENIFDGMADGEYLRLICNNVIPVYDGWKYDCKTGKVRMDSYISVNH